MPATPLDSVAVLSDIHGVLPALEAALAEPAVRDAAHLVVTGDTVAGPQPVEVLDRLLAEGDRVTLVRGNADREVLEIIDGTAADDLFPVDVWAAEQLAARPDLMAVVRAMPYPLTVDVAGFGPVLFCHGTPRDDAEVVLVDTRPQRWLESFAEVRHEVGTIVCGHTHMPFVRLVGGRTVINPGSIGMPYGHTGAPWAVLRNGGVTLGRTPYDIDTARAAIRGGCAYPDVDAWTDEYLNGRNGDLEALAAFGPRDGRAVS